jgi:hypothetical protein
MANKNRSQSFAALNDKIARKESSEFLTRAMNECRPDSGAYLAAKTELARRSEVAKHWRRVGVYVLLGLIGLALAFLGS